MQPAKSCQCAESPLRRSVDCDHIILHRHGNEQTTVSLPANIKREKNVVAPTTEGIVWPEREIGQGAEQLCGNVEGMSL